MLNEQTYYVLLFGWMGLSIILFPVLLKVTAPYGRHASRGWGPLIPNRAGWIIMELPSLLLFILLFLSGSNSRTIAMWVFFFAWTVHYTNRSLIYPLRIRTRTKKMPLTIMILAIVFNCFNSFFNACYLGYMEVDYPDSWLADPRFIIGLSLFLAGFAMNNLADSYLIRSRGEKKKEYIIPRGFLFNRISCPNFAGEILEWTGFAVMVWNPAGLSFALWTFVNLVPRALDHHRWYRQKFPEYPSSRKAVIPFIW